MVYPENGYVPPEQDGTDYTYGPGGVEKPTDIFTEEEPETSETAVWQDYTGDLDS